MITYNLSCKPIDRILRPVAANVALSCFSRVLAIELSTAERNVVPTIAVLFPYTRLLALSASSVAFGLLPLLKSDRLLVGPHQSLILGIGTGTVCVSVEVNNWHLRRSSTVLWPHNVLVVTSLIISHAPAETREAIRSSVHTSPLPVLELARPLCLLCSPPTGTIQCCQVPGLLQRPCRLAR
jgi:hypothetical protein